MNNTNIIETVRRLEAAMKGDVNIDNQDLLMAQGAFDEDEREDQWSKEYERYLDDLYEKERKKRAGIE